MTLHVCLGFPQQEWPITKVAVTSRALALSAGPWRRRVGWLSGRAELAAPGLSWVSFLSGGS